MIAEQSTLTNRYSTLRYEYDALHAEYDTLLDEDHEFERRRVFNLMFALSLEIDKEIYKLIAKMTK